MRGMGAEGFHEDGSLLAITASAFLILLREAPLWLWLS